VTEETGVAEGLTREEYARIVELLGRTPTMAELGVFAVQWSEHCSYKSSRIHLKKFPTQGERVIFGPGENSGVIDLGDGWASAFKVESHNHPSYVEPYQGAATGVGGILRDIFTMGARPIASLDSLRFGSLDHPRTRYLVDGVVRGIGDYGNCFGCPTVGGEVTFHSSYDGNCLVNAMNLGVMRKERIFQAVAAGVGNPVIYFGSRTGRDGIHGAGLLASAEFGEGDEDKRPTVQVGDPFTEKCLLEATLEVMERGLVVGIQDMGAAGLTCSSLEMAGRAGNGIRLDLDKVPLREERMTPYEILLSESQERMLLVTPAGREEEALEVFDRWGLQGVVVGEVTDDGHLSITRDGRLVARLPVPPLSDDLPSYDRPYERPPWQDEVQQLDLDGVPEPGDCGEVLRDLLASPNLCCRDWVWIQYDHMVRTNTVAGPGGDAAVVRVEGAGNKAVAVSIDCNPRFCYLDPRRGGMLAVAEAARNVACTGAVPIAITNCLNFGNPEKPPIMWQFVEAVEGMAEACRAFDTPVTGGNVSFYNETSGNAVHPTPAVGMVGLLEDARRAVGSWFVEEGDAIVLLGETRQDLGGSEYLAWRHGLEAGRPPEPDLEAETALCRLLAEAAEAGLLRSAHDCSAGGLAVTAAEACFRPPHLGAPLGCDLDLEAGPELRSDALLFGETPGRVLVSCRAGDSDRLLDLAARNGVSAAACGEVRSGRITLRREGEVLVDEDTAPLFRAWKEAFTRLAEGGADGREA
jgi:phosphoribosylformylglycinamidine synthase